jgi:ornithine--oxo-acid transaminase
VVSRDEVLGVLRPGEHGSTFGGNPLAVAIGREVLAMLATGELQQRSAELGAAMLARLRDEAPATVREVRGLGLWAGIELHPDTGPARRRCEALLADGVLVKDTHVSTLRLAPPLTIETADLDRGVDAVVRALA